MNNRDIFRILSPLIFFIFHLTYLLFWSKDPFLKKWIDGSFTFFLALVMCNIIRARVVAKNDQGDPPDDAGQDGDDSESNSTP